MANPADIQLAIASGLSMVCATCSKYHGAKARGLEKCLATDGCGSPIVGDTFHEYEGPITDFTRFCFVCGGKTKYGVDVKGHARRIGACEKHITYVAQMAPKEPRRLPVVDRAILTPQGSATVESLIPKPQKTLGQLIKSVEDGTFKPDT